MYATNKVDLPRWEFELSKKLVALSFTALLLLYGPGIRNGTVKPRLGRMVEV
jgi:hypothetical protein